MNRRLNGNLPLEDTIDGLDKFSIEKLLDHCQQRLDRARELEKDPERILGQIEIVTQLRARLEQTEDKDAGLGLDHNVHTRVLPCGSTVFTVATQPDFVGRKDCMVIIECLDGRKFTLKQENYCTRRSGFLLEPDGNGQAQIVEHGILSRTVIWQRLKQK